ncbi:Eco57I restriction-modification methylase domain-containing protein [Microbacterium aurum]|uniref:Eco57I restriction-modification methylase domain-containing protein n=1 Tax=Microbacterium aurum TaxID=36805 RepID=UPI0028E75987|nr:Eco57I restriction-modification methylase domain-containing protein [Microbacterium aurum]
MSAPVLEAKASFALRGHNPDVLTCIANLSNDEVFTPPELANQMLDTVANAWAVAHDGAVIWENPDVTFLDPFTKSGVFLREITRRLTEGLAEWEPDLETRVDHILTKQVYGIGITQLTALLARRSVYCSKDATGEHSIAKSFDRHWGNIWFERTEHTWAGDRCAYCGAAKAGYERGDALESHAYAFIHTTNPRALLATMFGADVQFDVIIGNPPYQLSTGGGTGTQQARPLYNLFVERAQALAPGAVCIVTPSRWFSGGMNLDAFRASMLDGRNLRKLVDFPDSRTAFGSVDIAGGVSYFLWDGGYRGQCEVTTVRPDGTTVVAIRDLDAHNVFVRDNEAADLLDRVRSAADFKPFSALVSAVSPFGLATSFRGEASAEGIPDPIVVRSTAGRHFASRKLIVKNRTLIDRWKVLLSSTSSEHAGQAAKDGRKRVLSRIELAEPGVVMTHSYLAIGPLANESEARNVAAYLRTRFVRYLASLTIITQHVSKATFDFVPAQDFAQVWTDSDLYAKYGLNDQEIALIESQIKPMIDEVANDA